jgi:hypothetical protein
MDTLTVVPYNSKVKLFLTSLYLIHVINERCTMMCSMSFIEVLT